MTPARQKAALQGVSAIAMKIYEVVPIAEAWDSHRIVGALNQVTRSHADFSIVRGCLNSLKDAKLVREVTRDVWQRAKVRELETGEETALDMTASAAPAAERPTLTLAKPQTPPPAPCPLELLGAIATRLRSAADSLSAIAGELDTVALLIDESRAESDSNLGKLRQLQSLLKDLRLA